MDFCSENSHLFYERGLAKINATRFFAAHSGIFVTEMGQWGAKGHLTVTDSSLNPHGMVHGGALVTLADTVGGVAMMGVGLSGVTLHQSYEFLRPSSGTQINCIATPEKLGKTVCIFRTVLTDDQDRKVGIGTFAYSVIGPLTMRDVDNIAD